jgi:hypothetical protein
VDKNQIAHSKNINIFAKNKFKINNHYLPMKKISYLLIIALIPILFLNSCEKECECEDVTVYRSWTRQVTDAEGVTFMAELKINSNNTFDWILLEEVPGHSNTTANITFDGNMMHVNDNDCPEQGTYEYAVSHDTFSLFMKEDHCEPRVIALQVIWTKK